MKFDSEQVLCHSTLGHKPDSKPFDYRDNALDSTRLKSGNGIVKENQNGVLSDLKANEGNADRLPYERNDGNVWNDSQLDCPMGVDYSANHNESFEKHSVFYLDKSVVECELPELIVCYKESTYHVVKDICIDEGVPSQDRFLFETGVDEKSVCTILPPEKDQNTEFMEEKPNIDMPIPDVLKCSAENDSDKDVVSQCDTMDLMLTGEVEDDAKGKTANDVSKESDTTDLMLTGEVKDDAKEKIANDVSKEKFTLGYMLSMEKLHTENSHSKSSSIDSNDAEQPSIQSSSEKAIKLNPALAAASAELNNDGKQTEESNNDSEELILARPPLVSACKESGSGRDETIMGSPAVGSASDESTNSSLVNDLSYNSKVETGTITFDFDPCAPRASGREECAQSTDNERLETQSSSRHEDANSKLVTSQAQYNHGESSFSMAGPISGLITYSGPIAYSGSLSVRSDSSTTSTRSFAFPILQSEWNSSPVRMAKADRRHYRKHRGSRLGFLCCRF